MSSVWKGPKSIVCMQVCFIVKHLKSPRTGTVGIYQDFSRSCRDLIILGPDVRSKMNVQGENVTENENEN